MRITGKLDYLEMPTGNGSLNATKSFYARVFDWSFVDYGPTYSAFSEGLDGGFDADREATAKPLPVLYAAKLEETLAAVTEAGGTIVKPIFAFPGGRRFHFTDLRATNLRSGATSSLPRSDVSKVDRVGSMTMMKRVQYDSH
ncbi:glyoxalase family protein [Brucella intermedia M86]|uniref:Glyoxalase family protein n=1 Tax=Brucella intermedia M86 TaxID=1234597 RepID=M5JJB5_9HYPH|nr:glyoxalase family protein [Brucella intermedia M86]